MQEAAAQARAAARIANLAVRAAVHEAAATGKPGLVCPDSRGAHDDMDFTVLLTGALSLRPYFADAAALGFRTARAEAKAALPRLRDLGRTAEAAMYKTTDGVNTHKGLIFSLGLFCAAAGRITCLDKPWSPALLAATASSYIPGLCGGDFAPLRGGAAVARLKALAAEPGMDHEMLWKRARKELSPLLGRTPSAGEILYACFDETGIRGEAESGFAHVPPACDALRAWLKTTECNDALVNTLLLLMRSVRDTNLLRRGGKQGLELVMRAAEEALDLGGMQAQKGRKAVEALARACAEKRLSPGGSADLLCLALFVILGEREAAIL